MNNAPYIAPQNRMTEEEVRGFSTDVDQPFIRIEEGEIMPLFIHISNHRFLSSSDMNFMAAISYDCKTKTIELAGRMRFESTGRKTFFRGKERKLFTAENLEEMKEMARNMDRLPFAEMLGTPAELEFAIGESADDVVQKMSASNLFNIGIPPLT